MELVKDTPLEVGWFTWPARPPRPSLTVVAKATFTLDEGELELAKKQEIVSGERYVDDDIARSLERDTDLAPYKPRGECFVLGACHPPEGEARVSQVAFQIGNVRKQLAVFGDRSWTMTGASEPAPFRSMPLSWERAFGGPGDADNPVGRGADGRSLPNLEDPQNLILSKTARPAPVCTTPIPRTWPIRARRAGTYDGLWLARRYPGYAEDLQWDYFNAAPLDQRIEGFFRGDEEIVLINLVAGKPRLRARLPGLVPRAFLTPAKSADPLAQLFEITLRLDTITVDAEAGQVWCVWRGVTEVATETLEEMGHLFVTAERERRSLEACRAALAAELERRRKDEEELKPEPAPPPRQEGAIFQTMMGAAVKWAHLDQALTMDAGGAPPDLLRELAAKLRERGVEIDPMGALGRPPESAAPPAAPPIDERELAALEARLLEDEKERARGAALELRRRVQEALMRGESCAGWDLTGADLSRLNVSGGDFSGARFVRTNLAGSTFGDTRFQGATFVEAELSDASFHGTSFEGAVFDFCRLERVHFGDAELDHASFDECFLRDARFSRSYGRKCALTNSHLEGATFNDSVFDGADFSGTTLNGALFARTSLVDAWMPDGISVTRVRFERCDVSLLRAAGGTDLSGATFAACVANGARFGGSICRGADFSFSELDRADFAGAELAGAKLMGCRLRKARFDRAKLRGSSLLRSDLYQARFEEADLRDADLRGASLFQAELFRASLEGVKLELADVTGTRIAR